MIELASDHPSVRWAWAARAWAVAVGGVSHGEFCVKVLKFEIKNSPKSFNYFIRVVPRTIKNGLFKNREDDTRSLSQN